MTKTEKKLSTTLSVCMLNNAVQNDNKEIQIKYCSIRELKI